MLAASFRSVFGTKHERDVKRMRPVVEAINAIEPDLQALSDSALRDKTEALRKRLADGEELDALLPEAFAAAREAARRPVHLRHFDTTLMGGIVLHEGKIAEMATGEGKTLVATMPLYLNALAGRGAHLVTVNDYLARRDSEWMGEIYKLLGLTVGCIQQGIDPPARRSQYECDITYGTNNEFGFDYLRDNMSVRPEHRVQRGFAYAIVDEVDSVLIDEARTPLIISGPVEHSDQAFDELKPLVERVVRAQSQLVNDVLSSAEKLIKEPEKEYDAGIALLKIQRAAPKNKRFTKLLSEQPGLKKLINRVELDYLRDKRLHELDEDLFYSIDEKARNVDLLEQGRDLMSPDDPDQFVVPDLPAQLSELEGRDELSAEEKVRQRDAIYRAYAVKNERIHNIQALLKAYSLFERDVEYVVQDGKVLIVDEFTGRLMPGRRYSEGLHQAIEAKEGVRVEGETQTLATITLQNFFRMYEKLAGMTGTAETEAHEFWEIYKLDVSVIPTHMPVVREDHDDVVYRTKREKYNSVIDEIVALHEQGQPVLVGTISVEVSELLSRMLKRRGIKHNVLNAKYHQQEAEIVSQAGQRGAVTIATNMAGRGTDIKLGSGVPDLGGLHILGTERHESRRIDRQLRGRAGRQGDPGSTRFYLSLEDDLMRLFGSERISGLMQRMGVQEGEVIEHPLVTGAISRAQKRVEAHNFDIRKHPLEYDNVMNQQRTVVYDLRNQALSSADLSQTVLEAIEDAVLERVAKYAGPTAAVGKPVHREEWNLKRHLYLYTIDEHWRDHLYELDHLTGGIGLRAYGQRDPLIEYKKEAYELFETLMTEVREDFVQRLFRVQLAPEAVRAIEQQPRAPRHIQTQHAEAQAFGPGRAPAAAAAEAVAGRNTAPAPATVVRSGPRVGRNDPCPCGSGKKYKKCHML